jgi:outer membrane receptor protein involved in Fe transport
MKLVDRFNRRPTYNSNIFTYYGAGYLQLEWDLLDWLTIIPGLRLSSFDYGTPLRIAPRFSAEFHLSDTFQFQTHAGRYYQFLSLSSNETFSGFDIWLISGGKVPPAYGDQFIAGIKTQPHDKYQFDAEIYYRTMHDLFEHDPFIPDQAGLPYHDILRFGEGFAYGSEIQLKKNAGNLTGFAGYTYNITLRRFPHHNEPVLQEGARYYPPKYHRAHEVSVLLDYTISPGWSTTATFTYSSGQPYTKPSTKTRAFDFPLTSAYVNQLIVENVNGSRLPPYHRLDLGITRRGTFLGLGEMELQLQAINVYSRRNVWFYDYELNDGSATYNEVTLLPLLPTLSLSLML